MKKMPARAQRSVLFGAIAGVGLLLLTACGSPAPAPTPTPTPIPTATPTATPVPTPTPVAGSGVSGGQPDFTLAAALWEGYWYSRYNFAQVAMLSGMGIPLEMPPMEMLQMAMQMADADPDDGDTIRMPVNPALVTAVYASGDPHLAQMMAIDMETGWITDFASARWDPASMDTTLTPAAQAQTVIKEIEWAKQFHYAPHFGEPTDNFGADQRFWGILLVMEAKMQLQFALQQLMNEDGLFASGVTFDGTTSNVTDATTTLADQYQMLEALSVTISGIGDQEQYPRYFDEQTAAMLGQATDMLFARIQGLAPSTLDERSWGARALTWYAANTTDSTARARALELIGSYGDGLIQDSYDGLKPSDRGKAIRGLIEAHRMSDDPKYLAAAKVAFKSLSESYDAATGSFVGQDTYTIWEVGDILGSLSALIQHAGDAVDHRRVETMLAGFFEGVINISSLQQSAPPVGLMMGAYETELPELYYRYPTQAPPPMAGGEFGIAPVFATEVRLDRNSGAWAIPNRRFDTAGAMYVANEMIWFNHVGGVNGFPTP